MAEITMDQIKEIREKTGAPINDCRNALIEANGDMAKAVDVLRERGVASASKKSSRAAKEGLVYSYIHATGKVGAMVELNCETDFVARTEDFEQLAKDIAMQITAMIPQYVKREDVPQEVIEKEKEIFKAQMKDSGKPEKVVEKIVEGKVEKYFKDACLLEQEFIKDGSKTVEVLVKEKIAKLGENIVVKRFVRFAIGEN
ncbi:MAG TPA: translation elongation factor Ts [bacterium]|nr:translation elongation factor Ts [bacterium]